MEDQTLEERIRLKAFQLWKQDGSMEGCADEYWRQAREMIEIEVLEENEKPPTESFNKREIPAWAQPLCLSCAQIFSGFTQIAHQRNLNNPDMKCSRDVAGHEARC